MDSFEILDDNLNVEKPAGPTIQIVSVNQFIILYIFSFGLYGLWWMFKSWKFFKDREFLDIMPAARAIFAILFLYRLLVKILQYAQVNHYKGNYNSGLLFGTFFLLQMFSRLPGIWGLFSLISALTLIPGVSALNFGIENSGEYDVEHSEGFNPWELGVIIFGGLLWVLIILGGLILE